MSSFQTLVPLAKPPPPSHLGAEVRIGTFRMGVSEGIERVSNRNGGPLNPVLLRDVQTDSGQTVYSTSAKILYSMRKWVWEMTTLEANTDADGPFRKHKIEVPFTSVAGLQLRLPEDQNQQGELVLELSQPPTSIAAGVQEPMNNPNWSKADDFTDGNLSRCRYHVVTFQACRPGALAKHFNKLFQWYPRFKELCDIGLPGWQDKDPSFEFAPQTVSTLQPPGDPKASAASTNPPSSLSTAASMYLAPPSSSTAAMLLPGGRKRRSDGLDISPVPLKVQQHQHQQHQHQHQHQQHQHQQHQHQQHQQQQHHNLQPGPMSLSLIDMDAPAVLLDDNALLQQMRREEQATQQLVAEAAAAAAVADAGAAPVPTAGDLSEASAARIAEAQQMQRLQEQQQRLDKCFPMLGVWLADVRGRSGAEAIATLERLLDTVTSYYDDSNPRHYSVDDLRLLSTIFAGLLVEKLRQITATSLSVDPQVYSRLSSKLGVWQAIHSLPQGQSPFQLAAMMVRKSLDSPGMAKAQSEAEAPAATATATETTTATATETTTAMGQQQQQPLEGSIAREHDIDSILGGTDAGSESAGLAAATNDDDDDDDDDATLAVVGTAAAAASGTSAPQGSLAYQSQNLSASRTAASPAAAAASAASATRAAAGTVPDNSAMMVVDAPPSAAMLLPNSSLGASPASAARQSIDDSSSPAGRSVPSSSASSASPSSASAAQQQQQQQQQQHRDGDKANPSADAARTAAAASSASVE